MQQRDDRAAGPALKQAGEPNLAEPTQVVGPDLLLAAQEDQQPDPQRGGPPGLGVLGVDQDERDDRANNAHQRQRDQGDRADTAPQGGQPFGVGELETGRFAESGAMHPQQADLADQRRRGDGDDEVAEVLAPQHSAGDGVDEKVADQRDSIGAGKPDERSPTESRVRCGLMRAVGSPALDG